MSIIVIKDLCFAHPGGEPLFRDLSLNIDTDWKLGLVGRNGRGKTTFLRILEGKLEHGGTVSLPFRPGYFPMEVRDRSLTAFGLLNELRPGGAGEGIQSEIPDPKTAWKLEREAERLKLRSEALKRPLSELSGGERTKVFLALLFVEDESFPLIDEPTGDLDAKGREVVEKYLASKRGFILVSHDRDLLDNSVDHILALNRDGVELIRGNFGLWLENRRIKEKSDESAAAKLKKEINRLTEASRRSARWADKAEKGKYGQGPVNRGFIGRKAAKVSRKAKNAAVRGERAAEEKRSIPRAGESPSVFFLRPLPPDGGIIAMGKDLAVGYDDKPVLTGLDFVLNPGDRLAATGPNGSGKSLFLKLLAGGGARVLGGEFRRKQRAIVSYVPQTADFSGMSLTDFALERKLDESRFKAVLRQLGFTSRELDNDFRSLSAGQKKKALIAASLLSEAHLYVWDEPLSNVDVITRTEIENLLVSSDATLAFSEHDAGFVKRVANRVLRLGANPGPGSPGSGDPRD